MKLLVVVPSLHCGGAERVASLLSQEWAKEHEVRLVIFDSTNLSYTYGGDLVDLQLPASNSLLAKPVRFLRRIITLSNLFKAVDPHRIISFMESANFPCIIASVLTGTHKRLLVSVHNDPRRFPFVFKLLIPVLYRLPFRTVAVSQGVKNALVHMGVPVNRLRSIPNPVPKDAPKLSVPLLKPKDVPERYVLAVGRLHHQKGFDQLIDAFASIADRDLHLVILGEGKERSNLLEQASSLGISSRVLMPGIQSDVWSWYRYAICFVLSSRYEGWGNVVLEAMSQSCPVIAFDCDYGPREIITHRLDGLLIPPGHLALLASSISELICNPALSKYLSANATVRVCKYYPSSLSRQWLA